MQDKERHYCPFCGSPLIYPRVVFAEDGPRTVTFAGVTVKMADIEFRAFRKLWERHPKTVLEATLMKAMWPAETRDAEKSTMRVHVTKLRKALRPLNIELETFTQRYRAGRGHLTRYGIRYPGATVMRQMIEKRRPVHPAVREVLQSES